MTATTTRTGTVRQLEHEMGVLVRRVRRVIGERARAVHPDLQPASYLMLAHLDESGPQRGSSLTETFGIDKGAISRQVQHLVDLGLVVRTPDPADGRAALLSLTDDGRARMRKVADQRRELLEQRFGDWSDADLVGFVNALSRYNRTLEP